jgi:ABC-type bacteriocin/lantibiotic exporter with double-glycine peptidase domain
VTRHGDAEKIFSPEGATVMIVLLVLALVLFLLGLFTVKLLWIAAIVLVIVWLVGKFRPTHGLLR